MSLDMEYRHQLDSLEASSLYVQPCGLEAWKRGGEAASAVILIQNFERQLM